MMCCQHGRRGFDRILSTRLSCIDNFDVTYLAVSCVSMSKELAFLSVLPFELKVE